MAGMEAPAHSVGRRILFYLMLAMIPVWSSACSYWWPARLTLLLRQEVQDRAGQRRFWEVQQRLSDYAGRH